MHGLGNDYIYVNCFEEKIEDPAAFAAKWSDRHFGIGSDGLIMICPSEVAQARMEMYNADGSRGPFAVGMAYRMGYFRQYLSLDGWQNQQLEQLQSEYLVGDDPAFPTPWGATVCYTSAPLRTKL